MAKKISAWAMFLRAFIVTLISGSAMNPAQADGHSDDAAWNYAVSLGTAAAMREYLRAYPTGEHIEEAIRFLLAMGDFVGTAELPTVMPQFVFAPVLPITLPPATITEAPQIATTLY